MIISEKYADIKKTVKRELSRERYQHTLGVAYTACCLAMRYGEDMERAYLAGILHDCAKEIPDDEKVELAKKYRLPVNEAEKQNPSLLHSKLGAYLAEARFHVKDAGIRRAILVHTTGRPDMDLLEKIIFIADYIEPNRDRAENLSEIRALAFQDLDRTVLRIAEDTLKYVRSKDKAAVDPNTEAVVNWYRKALKAGKKEEKGN